ncbi:hypothetical protein NST17_19280 [Caldifermentibacillus hisashii]|uniref:Uncharacterized protein n=1 Tax=Caldifermentibacillus hisashii TaxID=996558 RepID=A0ABU9K3C2_9BACI|nr:hypothetical protein [Caldibacillus thermoamylovorans]
MDRLLDRLAILSPGKNPKSAKITVEKINRGRRSIRLVKES